LTGSDARVYELLKEHPGYDFIIYPRVEEKIVSFPLLFSSTNVKVTAKLGKLKSNYFSLV